MGLSSSHSAAQVNDNEEDFSWGEEDEEEEDIASTHTIEKPSASEPSVKKLAEPKPEPASAIPAHLSSRESSGEESYDVVSSNVSAVGEEPKKEKEKDESEEDSDWE